MLNMIPLWSAIEEGRAKLGLSKGEYGRLVGLTLQSLKNIERGGNVRFATLSRLRSKGAVNVTTDLLESLLNN